MLIDQELAAFDGTLDDDLVEISGDGGQPSPATAEEADDFSPRPYSRTSNRRPGKPTNPRQSRRPPNRRRPLKSRRARRCSTTCSAGNRTARENQRCASSRGDGGDRFDLGEEVVAVEAGEPEPDAPQPEEATEIAVAPKSRKW